MKKLAPHFGQELIAAGLNEGVSWDADGNVLHHHIDPNDPDLALVSILTSEQETQLAALIAAHDPDAIPAPPAPRSVAMWRARTIMKVTAWGDGTLFESVQDAIAGLSDPLQKATAEEALERGDLFDRDGVFVPVLAGVVGISDEQLDDLMEQAAGLPA
jgi:hypothetical protein